jgi:hypothetical protein
MDPKKLKIAVSKVEKKMEKMTTFQQCSIYARLILKSRISRVRTRLKVSSFENPLKELFFFFKQTLEQNNDKIDGTFAWIVRFSLKF